MTVGAVKRLTYINMIALQVVARSKIDARLDSTFFAFVSMSATPMVNNGFRTAVAII